MQRMQMEGCIRP